MRRTQTSDINISTLRTPYFVKPFSTNTIFRIERCLSLHGQEYCYVQCTPEASDPALSLSAFDAVFFLFIDFVSEL